jgi:hypothetical protein
MKKLHPLFSVLFLISLGFGQNTNKIILKEEIQSYLFSTQEILMEYISIQDYFFSPILDTLEEKDYNLLSNSLDDYNNKLFQIKKNFYDSKTFQSNEKEDRLIKFLDNYIDLLSKTILQLKLISLKLDDVFSYSLDDYDKDLNTWEKLRDEYINEGQFLNFLLDDFLLSIE